MAFRERQRKRRRAVSPGRARGLGMSERAQTPRWQARERIRVVAACAWRYLPLRIPRSNATTVARAVLYFPHAQVPGYRRPGRFDLAFHCPKTERIRETGAEKQSDHASRCI